MAASDVTSDAQLNQPAAPATEGFQPEPEDDAATGGTMSLVEHLEELRKRLMISAIAIVVCTIVAFFFWEPVLRLLLTPLPSVTPHLVGVDAQQKLVQKDIGEAFVVALKLSLAVGLTVAMPVVLYQVWAFIAPALTRRERKYALPFTVLGVGLFAIGITVGFFVLRYPVEWLIGFGSQNFVLLLDAGSYFSFVAFFLLAFGIVFELPLVITFMGMVGILNSRILREKRMYILFGLWVLSCFITPGADPYSPVIIGVSFTALFELSIVLLRILKK